MADATARFSVKLDDETSGAANDAAGALSKLERSILKDQKALADLEKVMKASKKATFDASVNYIGMAANIQSKRNAIAGSIREFHALGGSFGMAGKHAKEGAAAAKAIGEGLAALGKKSEPVKKSPVFDPKQWQSLAAASKTFAVATKSSVAPAAEAASKAVHASGASFDQLATAAKKAGFGAPDAIADLVGAVSTLPGALLTASAAAVAFAAAMAAVVVGGIFKLMSAAIASQEELEGVSQAAINVAKRSPIARSEIAKLSDELEKTGLRGEALEVALDKAVKKKFGKAAEKSMMGLSVQLAKAKENITMLFTGVKTGPLLEAVERLLKFFDATTVEGKALQTLIETLLNPLIGAIGTAGPAAKKFFQGMIIGALMVAIAVLTVKKRIEEMLGLKVDLGAVDWTTLGIAIAMVAAALALVAIAIAGVIAWVGLMTAGVFLVIGALVALGVMIIGAFAGIPAAIASINNFIISRAAAMVDAGMQFAAGLADGIRNGLSEVINAATELAGSAVKAVKDALQMHSPSKLALDIGGNFGGSMAAGAEQSVGQVERAAMGLGEALVPPQKGGALAGAGGSGPAIHIDQLIVQGVEGADDPAFAAKLAETLQQALALAGMAPA